MKKLFIVSLLSLSLLLSVFDPSTMAGANAAGQNKAKVETKAKSKSKSKTNSKSKSTTKSKSKSKTKAKSKSKTKAKSKSKTKAKSKAKSKSKSTTKSKKVASRSSYGSYDVTRIISVGMSLKGTPYKYGGSSPKGFDCSGFTSYVFKKAAGISLPRTSGGQASAGTSVTKNELQPGDLVYFNTNGKSISHVGIYIGDGNFIHASRTKGITVTSLSDSYYRTRYLGATRIK